MPEPIHLTASVPVLIRAQNNTEPVASDGDVYTWDGSLSQYGPEPVVERLVTHEVTAGNFELVYHSDGSLVWHS